MSNPYSFSEVEDYRGVPLRDSDEAFLRRREAIQRRQQARKLEESRDVATPMNNINNDDVPSIMTMFKTEPVDTAISGSIQGGRTSEVEPLTKENWFHNIPALYTKRAKTLDPDCLNILEEHRSYMKTCHIQALPLFNGMKAFAFHNNLVDMPIGELIVLFLIQRRKSNPTLKAASSVTMAHNLRSYCLLAFGSMKPKERQILHNFILKTELDAMSEQVEHATDITSEFAKKVIVEAPTENIKAAAFVMTVASPRHEDVTAINTVSYNKKNSKLIVDYGRRKNQRFQIMRKSTAYPVPTEFQNCITEKQLNNTVWSNFPKNNLTKLNEHMKALYVTGEKEKDEKLKTTGRGKATVVKEEPTAEGNRRSKQMPSSYSLRRLAIQRFVSTNTDKDGKVDWETTIELSGHLSKDMPKHIYTKTAREIANTEVFLAGDEKDEPCSPKEGDIVTVEDDDVIELEL